MTKKMTRAAEVRASSFDESDNSVEVVWTTGASVRRRDWRTGDYYQEILEVTPKAVRLDRLNAGAPFLDTHDDTSLRTIIGSVVPGSAKIEGGKGVARVRLSSTPGDADTIDKIKSGIIRNISVGYTIHKVRIEDGADGEDQVRTVTLWEPLEISAVPIPADAGAQIRASGVDDMPAPAGAIREAIDGQVGDAEIAAALRFGWAAAWLDGDVSPSANADGAFRAMWAETRNFELSSMAATAAAAFSIARAA